MARASGSLGFLDLRGLRSADLKGFARLGDRGGAQRRDLDLGYARDSGNGRGAVQLARLQLGGRRGLLANRRGNGLLERLLGLLLVVLPPMVIRRRRFVVFLLSITHRVQAARSNQRTAEDIKGAQPGGSVECQAGNDSQFRRPPSRPLEPRGDKNHQPRRGGQGDEVGVAVPEQAIFIKIAVIPDDHGKNADQDQRRADRRPELLVDFRTMAGT